MIQTQQKHLHIYNAQKLLYRITNLIRDASLLSKINTIDHYQFTQTRRKKKATYPNTQWKTRKWIKPKLMNETYAKKKSKIKKLKEIIYLQESSRKSGGRQRAWNWATRKQWQCEMEALSQHSSSSQQEIFIYKIRSLLCDSFELIWKRNTVDERIVIGKTWKCGETMASAWRCPKRRKCFLAWSWLLRRVSMPRFGRQWSGDQT